jgi:hypothetical protein
MNSPSELRKWLRKSGACKLVFRKGDGDDEKERTVTVDATAGNAKWAKVEKAALTWGAEKLEALDKSGDMIDAFSMNEDDEGKLSKDDGKSGGAHDYRGLAQVIDRIAARHNEAFNAGAASAAQTVGALTEMVDTLTSHLSLAITNVHNLSINLAHAISGQDQPEPQSQGNPMLERVLVAAATSMGAGVAQQQPQTNGKKP